MQFTRSTPLPLFQKAKSQTKQIHMHFFSPLVIKKAGSHLMHDVWQHEFCKSSFRSDQCCLANTEIKSLTPNSKEQWSNQLLPTFPLEIPYFWMQTLDDDKTNSARILSRAKIPKMEVDIYQFVISLITASSDSHLLIKTELLHSSR